MVGLLVVLVLAAAVLGLAVAILAIMVMQGVEEDRRLVPAPAPRRVPRLAPRLDLVIPIRISRTVTLERATPPAPTPAMAASRPVNRRSEGVSE